MYGLLLKLLTNQKCTVSCKEGLLCTSVEDKQQSLAFVMLSLFLIFDLFFSHSFHIILNYLLIYMGGFDPEQKSEIDVQVEIGY